VGHSPQAAPGHLLFTYIGQGKKGGRRREGGREGRKVGGKEEGVDGTSFSLTPPSLPPFLLSSSHFPRPCIHLASSSTPLSARTAFPLCVTSRRSAPIFFLSPLPPSLPPLLLPQAMHPPRLLFHPSLGMAGFLFKRDEKKNDDWHYPWDLCGSIYRVRGRYPLPSLPPSLLFKRGRREEK